MLPSYLRGVTMLDKERLLKISEIDSSAVTRMDPSQLQAYANAVSGFVDSFPALEEDVKNALKSKDRNALVQVLTDVNSMLRGV